LSYGDTRKLAGRSMRCHRPSASKSTLCCP